MSERWGLSVAVIGPPASVPARGSRAEWNARNKERRLEDEGNFHREPLEADRANNGIDTLPSTQSQGGSREGGSLATSFDVAAGLGPVDPKRARGDKNAAIGSRQRRRNKGVSQIGSNCRMRC